MLRRDVIELSLVDRMRMTSPKPSAEVVRVSRFDSPSRAKVEGARGVRGTADLKFMGFHERTGQDLRDHESP